MPRQALEEADLDRASVPGAVDGNHLQVQVLGLVAVLLLLGLALQQTGRLKELPLEQISRRTSQVLLAVLSSRVLTYMTQLTLASILNRSLWHLLKLLSPAISILLPPIQMACRWVMRTMDL